MAAAALEPEQLSVKTSFGEIAAKGTTIILLFAVATVGVLALREHTKREAAEKRIENLLNQQNDLLHNQTDILIDKIDEVKCNLGIDIFVHQFSRGEVDWNLLPVQLYNCLPEYSKKLPKGEKVK